MSDSLHMVPWQKVDLDLNGLKDLLVIGRKDAVFGLDHFILCVMDKGDCNYDIKALTRENFWRVCSVPVVKMKEGVPVVELHYPGLPQAYITNPHGEFAFIKHEPVQKRTMTYKFGDFMEFRAKPAEHHIEKI